MKRVLTLDKKALPATSTLLRMVFGSYTVPPVTEGGYAMEAALLGVDYVKLVISGLQKLPVLMLVGPNGCVADLFLRWMKEVLHLSVRQHLLTERDGRMDSTGLVVWRGEPDAQLFRQLEAVQHTGGLCFFPEDRERHRDVRFNPALCIRCQGLPDPEGLRAMSWLRVVHPEVIGGADELLLMAQLTIERPLFMAMLTEQPFHTRPTTAVWFHPDQFCPPEDLAA